MRQFVASSRRRDHRHRYELLAACPAQPQFDIDRAGGNTFFDPS
jgi:hypothetical protein